jgi:ATP-dependent RNA helicase DDX3X
MPTNDRWSEQDVRSEGRGGGGGGGYSGGGGGGYSGGGGGGGRDWSQMTNRNERLEHDIFGDTSKPKMASGINFDKYDDIPVEATGNDVPPPFMTYEEAHYNAAIVNNLALCGYAKPTPVQKYASPIVRAKRDIMSCK